MCGIVGIWNQTDEKVVRKMAQSVAHRGPDGLTCVTQDNSSLGASLLAIVGDPSATPVFCDIETNVAVLLNGEIYNVDALRTQLAANGIIFHTNLESEVIAKLYVHYGLGFAERLKGMFAVVILDGDQLLLTRDRFGIKPLYYAELGAKVIFGSEIKALLAHPSISPQLNIAALQESMVFGYIYSADKTLFQGIQQVEPGTVVNFCEGKRSVQKFGELPQARYQDEGEHPKYQTAIAQLREHLIETMDLLLRHGDHPMGIYLSGGLDSTILTLVARVILDRPVTTFTLADDNTTPDFLAAREVAQRLGTQHVERVVGLQDYFSRLEHFATHYESLLAGGVFDLQGAPAFHLISETVSQHVRVAFSGEGADELFGGYPWIYTHPLGFSDRIRGRMNSVSAGDELRQIVDELFPSPEDERIYRRNLFDTLVRSGLANCHLQSVDRSSGAFGFEVRPAYLFDDLADFALRLPIEYKVPDKWATKRILRDAFRPELERLGLGWVLERKKMGMPSALSNIAKPIQKRMEAEVSDTAFSERPMKDYLHTKTDVYLFDIFSKAFLSEPVNV